VVGLSEEAIKKILKNIGLTEKEAEVYIFLAEHEPLNGGEITKSLKKDRAQVFRILKRLQAKGLVESTLEFPARFTVVPFKTVIESSIKAKREEVAFIEKTKKDLLSYLKKRRQTKIEAALEKFVVIKGSNRIYSKIARIVRNTKRQLSAAVTVSNMVRAEQLGIFDIAANNPSKSQIQYRFLTELSEQNLRTAKAVIKRTLNAGFNFRARNSNVASRLFHRMVIRDNEEILFFITPKTVKTKKDDICLWTNCKTIVQAFTIVFEELWRNSTDIQKKIVEIELANRQQKPALLTI